MRFPVSTISRLALIMPVMAITYFGYLYLSGSVGDPAVDFLGAGKARENGGRQQDAQPDMTSALQRKAAQLKQREEAVARREQEMAVLERDLLRIRQEIADERAELEKDKAEFERQETERNSARITLIANTLKNTKAAVAAAQLIALYERNRTTALYILSRLDSRSAGKIFSKMTKADLAAQIIEDLKAWRVAQDTAVDTTSGR